MGIERRQNRLRIHPGLAPAGPLWQRVPTRTPEGELASDFMMLIPGLRRRPQDQLQRVLDDIYAVLSRYGKAVLFADMNLKLNVLWVSVRPTPGIILELAAALNMQVPEARLISRPHPGY